MDFGQITLVAFLVEAIIQAIKPIYDKSKGFNLDAVISLGIGILVCVLTGFDLFSRLGFNMPQYVGPVLTGVIASRGSNLAHDALKFVESRSRPAPGDGAAG